MNELVDAVIALPILAAMILGALPPARDPRMPPHLRKQPPPLRKTADV